MKRIYYFILLFTFSCSSIQSLVYEIPNTEAKNKIEEEVQLLLKYKKDIFIILEGSNNYGYIVTIVPTNDIEANNVLNLNIKNTNRVLDINFKHYYIFFSLDGELGAIKRKASKEEEKDMEEDGIYIIQKQATIYDHATTLYFDKDWNFIKKSSLINFK